MKLEDHMLSSWVGACMRCVWVGVGAEEDACRRRVEARFKVVDSEAVLAGTKYVARNVD